MLWQSSESWSEPWKLGPLFIHMSACRALGGSESCTCNEVTRVIFSVWDRQTPTFALQWGLILIHVMSRHLALSSWVQHLHKLMPQPPLCSIWWRNRAVCQCCSLWLQSSEQLRVSGEHLAPLKQPGTVGVWSCIASSSFSLAPLFDFVLPVLHRGSHREEKGKGEEKDKAAACLISAKLTVFLWLFVMPPLLPLLPKATAPWCT